MKDHSVSSSSMGSVSLGPAPDSNSNDDDDGQMEEMDLSDICEVVISLKCKKCEFLCNDKPTLAHHIKLTHIPNSKSLSSGNSPDNGVVSSSNGKEIEPKESRGNGTPTTVKTERNGRKANGNGNASSTTSKKPSLQKLKHKQKNCKTKNNSQASSVDRGNGVQEAADDNDNPGDESVEDVFLCAECDIVFSSRETCCSHMHLRHGLKQFTADFIQEEIISKPCEVQKSTKRRKTRMPRKFTQDAGSIVPKKYRVTKEIFHSCTKCTIKFENVDVMKFHEKCHLTATSRGDEGELADSIVIPKGFLCPVCESNGNTGNGQESPMFTKWGPCAWHLWKEHRIDCELYTCSHCKQFKSHLSARVKDHEQVHSSDANFKCKTCSKTFKQMKQLRCHEKYHKDNLTKLAPEKDSRWYTPKECPICKRVLSDSKCLKKHISAVHNKLKPYVCNICGHTSARKQELLLHVRQHTGEKPYKCPICPFQTGDHNSLRKHKLRHSDERPYACPYCEYRCIQSCAFKKHILACHPGQEVVFLCQLCSHKSVNETLFAAHQKDHVEGRIETEKSKAVKIEATEKSPGTSSDEAGKVGTHSWSGDDDSLDIIDNGGVTIPATPPSPAVKCQKEDNLPAPKPNSKIVEVRRKGKKEILKVAVIQSPSPSNEFPAPTSSKCKADYYHDREWDSR